jgi:hypothetical protein
MARADKAQDAAYQKRYLADPAKRARHDATVARNRILNSQFRRNLLSEFSCTLCGIDDPDLIDWHHVNPKEKLFDIKGSLARNHDLWWNEVLKCIPVCALCHRKIHKNKLCLINPSAFKPVQDTENTYVLVSIYPQ